MTGLKQAIESALATPVDISGGAIKTLSTHIRTWSGWSDASLVFGTPTVSDIAECDHETRTFTVNLDRLVLNPHRIVRSVTPFRLRQEAVLTGAMLHESGHARHSRWLPRSIADIEAGIGLHGDGSTPTPATVSLARLLEEPRIEGLVAAEADYIGATGLGWTMRASAAHLIAPTGDLPADPDEQMMAIIKSWALRAGREIALMHNVPSYTPKPWVQNFTTLLQDRMKARLSRFYPVDTDDLSFDSVDYSDGSTQGAKHALNLLTLAITHDHDTGPLALDTARDILAILFPETEPPEVDDDCGGASSSTGAGEQGESGASEEDEDADESDEQDSGAGKDSDEADEPGDGDSEDEDDTDEDDDSGDEPEPEAKPEPKVKDKELAKMEGIANAFTKDDTDEEATKPIELPEPTGEQAPGGKAGGLSEAVTGGHWRNPTAEERTLAKGAEKFLRDLLDPSQSTTVTLDSSPSATVDGAALAAWKAGGQIREPHFFKRTRRSEEPSPPVKIAILVDVSGSMEELQAPSAVLSWALASAALDLRNFAGRGQQITSTLIHWGSSARVIQSPGQMLPGIREVPCFEGTSAMAEALDLVAEEIPGFFEASERPEHRLIVQFTDWELWGDSCTSRISQALASGVSMLTVAPRGYSARSSSLPGILARCSVQRGRRSLLRYNRNDQAAVWTQAAQELSL